MPFQIERVFCFDNIVCQLTKTRTWRVCTSIQLRGNHFHIASCGGLFGLEVMLTCIIFWNCSGFCYRPKDVSGANSIVVFNVHCYMGTARGSINTRQFVVSSDKTFVAVTDYGVKVGQNSKDWKDSAGLLA